MKKFFVSALIAVSCCLCGNATVLGDVVEKFKVMNGVAVNELTPGMGLPGVPMESGWAIMIPIEHIDEVDKALDATPKEMLISNSVEGAMYCDSESDPAEALVVTTANNMIAVLFLQGSPEMIEIIKKQ